MFPHESKGTLKLCPIQVPPDTGENESPRGDGLQIAPGHLEDETSVMRHHGDDPRAPFHTTDVLIMNQWLVRGERSKVCTTYSTCTMFTIQYNVMYMYIQKLYLIMINSFY